jgi:hypothetical protein
MYAGRMNRYRPVALFAALSLLAGGCSHHVPYAVSKQDRDRFAPFGKRSTAATTS